MKDKGHLWWKVRFFSICSKHGKYDKDCNMCNAGTWASVWRVWFNQKVYKIKNLV